jgi:hypothetical protein
MSERILQINFRFDVPRAEYDQLAAHAAEPIAATPGLHWKVWLMNEAEREAGGIYLFEDEASLQAFLNGPIVASVGSHPALKELSVKQFGVMADVTAVTRGPLGERVLEM